MATGPSPPVFYRMPTAQPVIFVTIDDGWVRDPRVIDFVRQAAWPISMFLVERAVLADPGYFRALEAAGATAEDHTYDHPRLTSLGLARQRQEVCRPVGDDPGLLGVAPTLLRPPYGAWNQATRRAAGSCGLRAVVEWSATMSDGLLQVVGGRLRGGDIVLLHFRPHLYDDLVGLRGIVAAAGLAVARLEDYLGPPSSAPQAPRPTTTVGPPTTGPTSTTTTPAPTSTNSTTTTSTSTTTTTTAAMTTTTVPSTSSPPSSEAP
jgi:hypothetical protein